MAPHRSGRRACRRVRGWQTSRPHFCVSHRVQTCRVAVPLIEFKQLSVKLPEGVNLGLRDPAHSKADAGAWWWRDVELGVRVEVKMPCLQGVTLLLLSITIQ